VDNKELNKIDQTILFALQQNPQASAIMQLGEALKQAIAKIEELEKKLEENKE
jgi:DNA-binding Lrp family transcriptional regulator